jgi:GMP synthase (glutamine-hydrolysing)
MKIEEITLDKLDAAKFVDEKCRELSDEVGDGLAINALSGGVDSSVVTMLGHKALGDRLKTYFIDNGIMRKGEPEQIARWFGDLGVPIEILDAKQQFFAALKGLSDPEEKREAITQTFYKDVFGDLVKTSGAKYLLQGTIFTDVEETVAGVKRQHNILSQLGINTQEQFGYDVIEPLIQLRKPGVRKVGEELGLPREMYDRPPFPGPALAARIIGEVTPERVALVSEATAIVEEELSGTGAFQYLAILHEDKVTGIRDGKRDYGFQIEVRCWNSKDAKTATPTRLDYDILEKIALRMTNEIPGVVSVTYNITSKPTSTIEAV